MFVYLKNNLYHQKAYKNDILRLPWFSSGFRVIAASKCENVLKWCKFPGY